MSGTVRLHLSVGDWRPHHAGVRGVACRSGLASGSQASFRGCGWESIGSDVYRFIASGRAEFAIRSRSCR